MADQPPRCPNCGSTEDAYAIVSTGVSTACAHREAIATLMQDLRASYGWQTRNSDQ